MNAELIIVLGARGNWIGMIALAASPLWKNVPVHLSLSKGPATGSDYTTSNIKELWVFEGIFNLQPAY